MIGWCEGHVCHSYAFSRIFLMNCSKWFRRKITFKLSKHVECQPVSISMQASMSYVRPQNALLNEFLHHVNWNDTVSVMKSKLSQRLRRRDQTVLQTISNFISKMYFYSIYLSPNRNKKIRCHLYDDGLTNAKTRRRANTNVWFPRARPHFSIIFLRWWCSPNRKKKLINWADSSCIAARNQIELNHPHSYKCFTLHWKWMLIKQIKMISLIIWNKLLVHFWGVNVNFRYYYTDASILIQNR